MAVSNEDVAAFIDAVLSGGGSDAEKAEIIAEAAAAYGVSYEQIAEATGYSQAAVEAYLEPVGSADDRQQDSIDAATVQPETPSYESPVYEPPVYEPPSDSAGSYVDDSAYTPVTAYDYATASGGIGLEAMNQNIRDFFAGNPTEAETRAAMAEYGVSEADIERATGRSLADYYPTQGALPVSTDTTSATRALTTSTETPTATQGALSTVGATAGAATPTVDAAEQQLRSDASAVGITLPANWFSLDGQQKSDWLTNAKVTESQITQVAGASGLEALKQYGYYDVPAKLAAEQEAERVAAAEKDKQIKESDTRPEERPADYVDPVKLAAWLATPGDKSRYVFDKTGGGYTFVVDTAYWDTQLNQLQTQVNALAAQGKTSEEIKAQLATIAGSDKVADYLASKTLVPAGNITDNFTAYVTPKTVDGQQYQVLDISKVVNYATQNNLPFAKVVSELSAQFPNLKVSDLQYEKDRQAVSGFIKTDPNDATKSTLSYTDALTAALQQGVSVDNLAKFFGQTPQQFTQTVKDNLGTFASTLKDAKLDPVTGLKSLLGIEAGDTTKALQEKAIQNDFATFASGFNKDNPLTYQKLGDYLDQKNISMQQAKDLLGFAPSDLATFRFTPEQRDVRQAYDTYTTQFNKDNPQTIQDLANFATANKLDAYQAAVALGLSDATITALNNELQFSPQERAWREAYQSTKTPISGEVVTQFQATNKLSDADMQRIFDIEPQKLQDLRITTALQSYSGSDKQLSYAELTQFAKDNNMDLSKVVDYIGTEETRPEILKNLRDYVKDEELKSSLSGVQLTDYQGKKYDADDLLNLANQIRQNFDLKGSSGGVYKTEGQSVGFDYDEAKKLFPEGKAPTAVDQVALDMARGLLQQGITDISEIAKYKPTEVTELDYNVEAGLPNEVKVTKYIDPATGKEFDPYIGATYTGKGGTNYYVDLTSGKPVFSTSYEDTSDRKDIGMVLAFAAAVLAPQILPELIGSAVGGVELAMLGGEAVAGTGLTGSLMAAGVPASIAPYAASMVVNGTFNGVMAEVSGGDFNKGFVSGIAPVIGQIASNAINTALAEFNLPSGADKAVGNAVSQLIATGKIDPTQMLIAGVTPAATKLIQDTTGLNATQTRLLLNTIATEGKNLQALTDPNKAISFVMENKGLFDGLGLDAASGATNINTGQAVDLGAFNEGEVKQLTSPTNQTLSTTGLDTTAFLEGNNIYNTGQGQFISVGPGQLRTLQDIYGYDPTAGGQATLGTKTDITPEDSGFAQLQGLRFLTAADRAAEDTGWAQQMLGYRIDPKTTTIQQIVDDSGKKHAIPAGAVLNYTPEGDLMGYRVNNVDYRLDKSGGVFKPYSPDTTVPSWNPENKSMDELYADFKKAVPGASTQQFQGWLMAAIAGQKSGMYVPMSSFNPTPEQKTTLLQDVSNIAKGVGSGVALGGTDLALATLGWAQAAARTAGYDVKFTSIDDVIKFQADMDKLGNKDFQNIFRSTISSLPTTAAVLLASSTGVGALGAGATAFTVAGATTAGREYATAYKDLINKGFTPEDAHSKALNRAALIGGVEGLGESIFPGADIKLVRSAMNLAPGDFLKQYGITLAKELPPEVATNLLQTYIDTLPGIGLKPGKEYSKDELVQILRDTTVTTAGQIAVMGGSARLINQFNSQPVTTSNGQQVLNRQGDPVLMLTTTQKPGFTLSLAGPLTGQTTVLPSETAQSSSSESIFDAVLENESKYGYTLQGVNLNNNTFTVKLDDGQISVFSAEDLLNKALNLRTMENKNLANDVTNSIDVGDRLAVDLAKSIQSLPASQVSGTIVSASSKGAIMETMEGQYIFVPNYNAPTARDGVAAGPIQLGDRVIASQNLVTPVTTVATPDGKTTVTVDTLRIDPAAGLGRIIGLNDTQALVVLPNQQVATVNRSNLAEATNVNLKAGSTIAVNPNVLSATNIPVATIQDDFGLTNEDLLRSVLTPSLTASQLPSLVSITTPSGQVETIDTRKPNISSGSVVSVDPSTNTALISSVLGKPQVVNLQGTNLQQGANVFFDPTTGTILGTPVSSQPQTATNVVAGTYTPIGTVTSTVSPITGNIDPNVVIPMNPKLPDYTPVGGIGIDTIPGLGLDKIDTVDINAGQTLVPITPTTPVETTANTTTTGVTKPPVKPRVPFPSLFFPYGEKKVIDTNYDNVVVPPPELPGAYEMPYPNYLRPLEPYLGFGLGTLMGDLNAKEPGNGGDQPLQNAQAQAAPAP